MVSLCSNENAHFINCPQTNEQTEECSSMHIAI
jgi:hypothetical protein